MSRGSTRAGPARQRWNARHTERDAPEHPAEFLTARCHLLPRHGRALDVAGGAGRNAVWLARRGLAVTVVDVSDVALEQAQAAASAAQVPLDVRRADLAPTTLPRGPFAVVVVHHFLDRAVWLALPHVLSPGGVLLACQPTERNLERHPRPSRRWLLEEGEGARLASAMTADADDLEVVEASEGWTDEGRHEARIVLRKATVRGR